MRLRRHEKKEFAWNSFDWYTIRGSNDVVGVRNVAKWRFDALPVLTYPGTYPNRN